MTTELYVQAGLVLTLALVWVVRGLIVGNLYFCLFMVWNIFLAAVPVLLLPLFPLAFDTSTNSVRVPVSVLLGIVWLLFLPNTYYLLTDLMHLNQKVLVNARDNKFTPSLEYKRGDALFIMDSFLLFLVGVFGGIMGGISLHKLYGFIQTELPDWRFFVMGIVILLCAVGVYIGRYARWNSWDVFLRPQKILRDFWGILRTAHQRTSLLIVVLTIAAFELLSWLAIAVYR